MSTYTPKASDVERSWHVVDAEGLVLGRLATEVANILRGKHKPTYTPNIDMGDHVIIVNADKVVLTLGQGRASKLVHHHSWLPRWSARRETYGESLARQPAEQAVRSVTITRHAPQEPARPGPDLAS